MRTLLVMRHAKSDWNAAYGPDHDRPLNDRGVRSAETMGRRLRTEAEVPDLVLTSTAVRARSTAELAAAAGDWGCEIRLEPLFYGAGVDDVISVAATAPPVAKVMVVGHQPVWSMLVSALTAERVEMKTGTVVVIHLDIDDWGALPGAGGRVAAIYQPRDLFDDDFESAP